MKGAVLVARRRAYGEAAAIRSEPADGAAHLGRDLWWNAAVRRQLARRHHHAPLGDRDTAASKRRERGRRAADLTRLPARPDAGALAVAHCQKTSDSTPTLRYIAIVHSPDRVSMRLPRPARGARDIPMASY